MTSLRQLERALLAAHEAGNEEDARILAAEIQRLTAPPEPVAEAKAKPETGYVANLKAGIESLKGDYYAGKAALFGDQEAAAEARLHARRAEEIGAVPGFTEHPLDYLTGNLGRSSAYIAAPVLASLALHPAGRVASIGAGALTSAAQFFGSDVSRQLDTGRPVEALNVPAAVGAAIPQAALDVVGFRFIPGIRRLFGAAGRQIAEHEAAGIVNRFILPAAKTAGVEGVTEAGQAVLERLQAGLSITDAEARQEYFDNFLGGAILGGALSIPGTVLEGRGAPPAVPAEKPVVPGTEPATPTQVAAQGAQAPEGAALIPEPTPVQPQALAAEAPIETALAAEVPAVTEVAPAEAAQVPVNVVKLMEQYDLAQTGLDNLATKIYEAQQAGDSESARSLQAEYRKIEEQAKADAEKIEQMGGFTGDFAAYESAATSEIKKLSGQIAELQKKVTSNRDPEVRDYDEADRLETRALKLAAKREEKIAELAAKRDLARVKGTPVNETISMFPEAVATPEPKNMLTLERRNEKGEVVAKETPEEIAKKTQGPESPIIALEQTLDKVKEKLRVYSEKPQLTKDETADKEALVEKQAALEQQLREYRSETNVDKEAIAAKQAEADALLDELTAMSPKYTSQNKLVNTPQGLPEAARTNLISALNARRAKYRELQELSARVSAASAQPGYSEKMDAQMESLRRQIAALEKQLAASSKAGATTAHIAEYNTKSEKLNQLYADIDALRGGFVRTPEPSLLFGKRNLLYTKAANTGNAEDMLALRLYEQAQARAKADKEKQDTRAQKEARIKAEQTRFDLPGRKVERTVYEEEYDRVMQEVETLMRKVPNPQGNAKKSVFQRAEELYAEISALEKLIESPEASAKEKGYARRKLETRLKDYTPLLKFIQNTRDEVSALLKSLTKVEPVKSDSVIEAEKAAALEAAGRTYREPSKQQKRFEKAKKGTMKADPSRVARDLAVGTDQYKTAVAELEKQDAKEQKLFDEFKEKGKKGLADFKEKFGETSQEYKAAEARFVQQTETKQEALNKAKAQREARKNEIAETIGRANPWFRSTLVAETKKARESEKTGGTPVKQSARTGQVTRKVAKLGTMSTGTPESQARSAAKQAAFEGDLTEEKGRSYDYQQRQEVIARAAQRRAAKEGQTAVGAAMREAAQKKLERDFKEGLASEKASEQRGSEIESKDLNKEQVKTLENNDVQAALASIAADATNTPVNRAVAAALEVYLDKTRVDVHDRLFADEGYELLGNATSKQINISRKGLTQETLLHEGVHAAAERVIRLAEEDITQLTEEQQAAYTELARLYNAIKDDADITSKNAKSSLSEFAAEALSNEKLQEQLRAKKWSIGNAFKSFTSYLLKMLGVKSVDNMLDASFSAVEALMRPTSAEVGVGVTETAREQAKGVGVVEKAKGVFGFKSFVPPGAPASSIVATEPTTIDKLKANFTGLAGRVEWVDKSAAISEAFAKGVEANVLSDLEAANGEYLLRFGENVSQFAQQALTHGRMTLVKTKREGGNEYTYRSDAGANLMRVYEALEKAGIKNSSELDNMFTVYMAGKRAEKVGWDKLWVGDPAVAQQEHARVMAQLNGNQAAKDAFEAAAKEYREFNNGLLDFVQQCGALTADEVAEFKRMDYVPYYRVNGGTGDVQLFSDKEKIVTIGNIKDEPQLQALVGDNSKILPLSVSAVQNAFLLTNMALRNNSVRDTGFLLHKLGIASTIGEGAGPAGYNTVRFKKDGKPHFVVIDSAKFGIPADLIVKGMEGIKTTMPFIVELMGKPANWVRKFVTRMPTYAVRQVVRDPMTAWLTNGVSGVPVLNALREMSSMVAGRSEVERKLMAAGAITSNVYTGGKEDLDKFLRDVGVGKTGWGKWMARFDAFALQGDAATRAVVYKDSIAKGMSEQQALLRTLESMNFGRRGLSPTLQMLNTLIPFFNSQIQGLDVIYRAFRGKMPYSQRLEIQQKLAARGALLAIGSIAYAYMMQDDDAYRRAKPEERLANWFVHLPGVKDPVKIPVPFELGYLFKSLPEAVINMSADDNRNKDITEGMRKLAWMSVPLSMPAASKPAVEVYINKSFFGTDIESQREVNSLQPTQRYRATTTELGKAIGSLTGDVGLSPIKVDHLIRGYTGGLGIALASILNPLMEDNRAAPTKDPHQWPLVGGLFQAAEGRGVRDAAYDRMLEIQQAKGTYKQLVQSGDREAALSFLQTHRKEIASASMSGRVQQKLGEYATMRRTIIDAKNLSQEKKDEMLKKIDAAGNAYAEKFLRATD